MPPRQGGNKRQILTLLLLFSLFYREVKECNVIRAFDSHVFFGLSHGMHCPTFSKF